MHTAEGWTCPYPRAYPDLDPDNACTLAFATGGSGSAEPAKIWQGRFTVSAPQILAMYDADCESHANNFGGAALFRLKDGKPDLIRYYPGLNLRDCLMVAGDASTLDTLYCHSSFMAQGEIEESFGPLRFANDTAWKQENWLEAGTNTNTPTALTKECSPQILTSKDACPFLSIDGLTLTQDQHLAVTVTYRDTHGAKAAEERLKQGDFTPEEKEQRDFYPFIADTPLLRDGEYTDRQARIIFDPATKSSRIEILP